MYQPATNTETGPPIPGLIGTSPAMEAVYRLTRKVAKTNASVLLLGETGTGKEMIATAIHRLSTRSSGPSSRTAIPCKFVVPFFRPTAPPFAGGNDVISSSTRCSSPGCQRAVNS